MAPGDQFAEQLVVNRPVLPPEKLTELRERGPVSASIADLHEDVDLDFDGLRVERARVKTEALAAVPGFTVTLGRKWYTVSDIRVENGALSCHVDGVPEEANPFLFFNPPVMVPDGDGFREDPAEALRIIVTDAVTRVV